MKDIKVKKERGVSYADTIDILMVKLDDHPVIIDCDALIETIREAQRKGSDGILMGFGVSNNFNVREVCFDFVKSRKMSESEIIQRDAQEKSHNLKG